MTTGRRAERPLGRSRGAALMFVLVAAGLLAAILVFNVFTTGAKQQEQERERATREALLRAKEALITYAVTYSERNVNQVAGFLPCPDQGPTTWIFNNAREGVANAQCGNRDVSQIGKLPWYTLGVEPLRDADGECLWYAVAGNFKNSPKTAGMVNWDALGLLRVGTPNATGTGLDWLAGSTTTNRAVAVVFAPGRSLGAQDRTSVDGTPNCGGNYNAANYLDAQLGVNNAEANGTANALSSYVAGRPAPDFNDQVVYITAQELFDRIARHQGFQARIRTLTQKVAQCIAEYAKPDTGAQTDFRIPWAAPVSVADYANHAAYGDQLSAEMGRVPFVTAESRARTHVAATVLLRQRPNGRCGAYWDDETVEWYEHWKDHLFLAVSDRFEPSDPAGTSTCGLSGCVRVGSTPYRGIVFFAGRALPGQNRSTNAQKGVLGNYLEGLNLTSFPNNSGQGSFASGSSSAFAATGSSNDLLYCIPPGSSTPVPC